MVTIKRVMLDVLKPHEPTIVEMARELAKQGDDYKVSIRVTEIDEKTETLELTVTGPDVDLQRIEEVIEDLGGAVHSIDEVVVGSGPLPA
jgi:hypothetical protein